MFKINDITIMPHAIESYKYTEDEKSLGMMEGGTTDSIIVRTVSGMEYNQKVKDREEFNKLAETINNLVCNRNLYKVEPT
jgi:hypothetical protein